MSFFLKTFSLELTQKLIKRKIVDRRTCLSQMTEYQ